MFLGTTTQVISQYVTERIKEHKPARVFEPFAGNFVIAQLVGLADRNIEVHSTDVSLYSRAIGYALSDQESEIKLRDEYLADFPIFKGFQSPEDKAVSVIFFAEVATMYRKAHIPYYVNLLKDSIANQEMYVAKIRQKLKDVREIIPHNFVFYGTDGIPISRMAEKGDFLYYDPPFFLDGYEKMFADLEECFEFKQPDYTQMTEEIKLEDLTAFAEKEVITYYRTLNPTDELPDAYREVFRYRYKYHAHYCLYTNADTENIFVGTFSPLKEEARTYPIISIEDEITKESEIQIVKVPAPVGNHYRLLWIKKASMTNGGGSYLVLIDGKVIGVIQLMDAMRFGNTLAVIFSDPSAPTSRYKRLSKLLLYLCCTDEMLKMFNEQMMWEHNGFTTAVFTNHPESMKYRGLFKRVDRKENPEGFFKYILTYQNRDKILPTFRAGLLRWIQKDAKHLQI